MRQFTTRRFFEATCLAGFVAAWVSIGLGAEPAQETQAQRGYRLLTTKAYLPPDFDQEVFDELWKTWEPDLRAQAEQATPDQRRKMAFSRYGLTDSPGREGGVAMQYVDDGQGGWVMNCLACHGGKVAGQIIPGLPNSRYALQTLTEEVRATKLRLGKPLSHLDLGSLTIPLGSTVGTTNAVMFGVSLLAHRDADLNVRRNLARPKLTHHDHDAPPWWNVKRKKRLYADGFVARGHRALMQFLLIPQNGPDAFRSWEQDYADIEAWMETLQPPRYPFAIDRELASAGKGVFDHRCAECHGTYADPRIADRAAGGRTPAESDPGFYPEKTIPIDVIGTDPTRFQAIAREAKERYAQSWFNHYGEKQGDLDPVGYVAPPLDGVWASAPYFHNGSVPNLWSVLRPKSRPAIWRRSSEDGYDQEKVGLEIAEFPEIPADIPSAAIRREYFDTRNPGKSSAGHEFPEALSEGEKRAVLEFLKTL